jgi:hypothetical protein
MNADMSYTTFEESYGNELYSDFKNLYESFVLKGHNVIIGEMGITNKNNTEERLKWAKYYVETSRRFNIPCVVWDNEYFDNTKSSSETFGLYKRGEGKWVPDDLINTYVAAAGAKMEDNPVEKYGNSLIENPVEFEEWKQNFEVGVGTFSAYNSYCRLVIETSEPSYNPQYRMFILYLGDWSTYVDTTDEEVFGASTNGEGGLTFGYGKNNINVVFSEKNLDLVKQRGMYIIGHGFSLTRIAIVGPKLISFEPQNIVKSKTKEQRVTLTFSEDATDLVGNIKFKYKFYNINKKLACIADAENKNIIHCEGLYDFTGEYQLTDDKGVLLTSRTLNVIPNYGERYDINNLLEEKYLFDFPLKPGIKLPSRLFTDVNDLTTLVLEVTELFVQPSHRALFIFEGDSKTPIFFDAEQVSTEVKGDGGIIVPENVELVKIVLGKSNLVFMERGVTLFGYGFGLKAVFLE